MDNLRLLQKVRGGYIAVLARGWRVDGSIVVDAANISELKEKLSRATRDDGWKTINGAHVLLDKNNYIVSGANGKFAGMKFGMKFHKPIMVKGKKSFALYGTHERRKMRIKKKESFVPIKDAKEIKSRLTAAGYNLKSLRGMDKNLAIAQANQLLRLDDKFKLLKEAKIDIRMSGSRRAVAYVSTTYKNPENMELVFNPKRFNDYNRLIAATEFSQREKYLMPTTKENYGIAAVTHEYGHMLQNVIISREIKSLKSTNVDYQAVYNKVSKRCYDEIKEIAKQRNPNFKIADSLSTYGAKNRNEFFAEVFMNSQLGAPNELGDAMNIWLKQKGLC